MTDEIIKELREIRDAIARESGNDLDTLVARLQRESQAAGRQPVDLRSLKKAAVAGGSARGQRHP